MNERISALRVQLQDCDQETPAGILRPHLPVDYTQRSWIPQTAAEQIWVMFEFVDQEEREKWEGSLPDNIRKWLDRDLIENALTYGWFTRNINGFVEGD